MCADLVMLNKTDLLPPDEIARVTRAVSEATGAARKGDRDAGRPR